MPSYLEFRVAIRHLRAPTWRHVVISADAADDNAELRADWTAGWDPDSFDLAWPKARFDK